MADVYDNAPYDSPNFTIRRQETLKTQQGPAASATDFAIFRTRNRAIVTHAIVTCLSLPSAATTWSLRVMRDGATTIATKILTGFSAVAGLSAAVITIAADGTLNSVSNFVSLEMGTTEKGKFDVVWEYQLLPRPNE